MLIILRIKKYLYIFNFFAGEPLDVAMDLTIASFDAISEVNMVITFNFTIIIFLAYNSLS